MYCTQSLGKFLNPIDPRNFHTAGVIKLIKHFESPNKNTFTEIKINSMLIGTAFCSACVEGLKFTISLPGLAGKGTLEVVRYFARNQELFISANKHLPTRVSISSTAIKVKNYILGAFASLATVLGRMFSSEKISHWNIKFQITYRNVSDPQRFRNYLKNHHTEEIKVKPPQKSQADVAAEFERNAKVKKEEKVKEPEPVSSKPNKTCILF